MTAQPESKKVNFPPVEEQLAYVRKGAAEIIPEADLVAKFTASRASGKPLRVKLGVDPTAPDIHLGHTVVLRKLKHFQDLGHTAVFLIGDFTAMVGDPTGQSETRPPLTREQVNAHAKTYLDQVYKILDKEKTEIRYNSEWLDKLTSQEMIRLCAKYRLARMLEREDFRSRLEKNQPISVHELLYPLIVAYDSVVLEADIELGATEQKFNLLMGREIQREYDKPLQVAFTMPILVGLDGERKMSKSLGNYVGITETPQEMFGKLMSISDEQMWLYMELLTDRLPTEIVRLRRHVAEGAAHPKAVKIGLAEEIVAGFHGQTAANHAAAEFDRIYSKRQLPSEMQAFSFNSQGDMRLSRLIHRCVLASSGSEAERLIDQGAVEWDGIKISDTAYHIKMDSVGEHTLRVGKKPAVLVVINKP
jgi:tyrosyl-tRNA synthetase